MPMTLPSGRLGRAVAWSATLLLGLIIWFALVQPIRHWYAEGDALLNQRDAYAARMVALVAEIPALARRAAAVNASGGPSAGLLDSDTDAMAGAKLQEVVQGLAQGAGITPTSIENLPAVPLSHYRRIALRFSAVGQFPAMVQLLRAIALASPRMMVDELRLEGAQLLNQPIDAPVRAELTVVALRAAGSARPSPTLSPGP